MTNKIALTASMRSNLLSLQSTQKLFDSTQDRLASGYKVNSAMDNPSSYFTAQALNSRANDLSGLLDSIGQAISTLQTADQGITTLQSFVEQAKSIANNARDTANVASKATTNNVKFDPDNARTEQLSDYVNVTAGPAPKAVMGNSALAADDKLVADLNLTTGSTIAFTVGDDAAVNVAVAADDTVESYLAKVVEQVGSDKIKAELVDGSIKFSTLNNADLKIESARTNETHNSMEYTFANTDDVSGWGDTNALTMGDGTTSFNVDLTGVKNTQAATGVGAHLTDEELSAAAQAYADAINRASAANGGYIVATADGATVTIKDMKVGNDTAAPAMATQPAADDDTGTFGVPVPGTSAAEKLGFASNKVEGTAEAGNSFSIRLGDATKMVGTANLRADKTLEELGMADGQSIDIIVGDQVHTYTVGDGAGEIAKTSTLQEFMDNIVYDIGRTKIKAEIVDGVMTISTLDNSSLSIRSTNQVETRDAAKIEASVFGVANREFTSITFTPDGAAAPITVDLTGVTTAEGAANAINANDDAKAAGIMAKVDVNGNLVIFDKDADHAAPSAVQIDYTTNSAAGNTAGVAGKADYELKGTSFNELVGFKADQTVEVTDDMTVEQFRQAINNLDGVSADFDTKGHLVIAGEQGDDLVMVNDANSNVLKNLFGNDVVSATNGSNERAKYAKQFDDILRQVDQLVQDTSYKGINLLNGDDLTVVFNESRTSTLELKGVTFDSTGLGFTRSINEWISNEDIDKALNQITKATSLLRAQASEFGQNLSTVQIREDFTQNMINNLQSGADKLTLADMNEEAANMLALQTRQQLATNSLSLANQAAQSVLRLF